MTRGRTTSSVLGSPVLVGAITMLIVVVAVFLAYNANNGLPFVPTYDLKAKVPNAANLVPGNEVRVGGHRVGAITEIRPFRQPDGNTIVILHLKLDKALEPLPVDSHILVRSALVARPQVPRDHAGLRRPGTARATRCPWPRPLPGRSRSTRSSTSSTRPPGAASGEASRDMAPGSPAGAPA